ncbi:winged helix-turn-helix domain-containing protein [Enterococcus sp. LJL51]|uniref:winged helix-turn-helix domain-containing protein n=1 Tax=Enterococcus sp. LJL51 TaxID=3416656 RepID=UPI003CF30340
MSQIQIRVGYLLLDENQNDYVSRLWNDEMYKLYNINDELGNPKDWENKLDIVLVEGNHIDNIGQICQQIIEIKQNLNVLLWVISSEKIDNTFRLLYLRLGAIGVIDSEDYFNEFYLISKNFSEYNAKKTFSNNEVEDTIQKTNNRLRLFPENRSIILETGEEIELTRMEYNVICFLYDRSEEVVTYEEIYKHIWSEEASMQKYRVSYVIFRLRKKLEKNTRNRKYIETVRSLGYKLIVESTL